MSAQEQFRINLNQNLWGLVAAFAALGAAEYFKLSALFWFAVAISLVMSVSVASTTFAYTVKYLKNKGE